MMCLGCGTALSPNCLADFTLLICIMCMVHHVCIHHIGMPDILAQYTRALKRFPSTIGNLYITDFKENIFLAGEFVG